MKLPGAMARGRPAPRRRFQHRTIWRATSGSTSSLAPSPRLPRLRSTLYRPLNKPSITGILLRMPANLTPQYMDAEKRFKEAQTVEAKIAALEEMMATIPRHKGTEKLKADLKKKMSGLRKESEQSKKGGRRESYLVEHEGARQLTLIGAP